VATVTDGVAVKLRGNPRHPYSQGELCPKVNRFLDRVYHPDRILTPLIREGAKGEGRFRPVSWEEALDVVATRLRDVLDRAGGEAILPWHSAGTQGLIQMSSLDRRFFARLGAIRPTGSLCGAAAKAGLAATYGDGRSADPMDVRFARLVLLWGTNTRLTNRHLWPFVEEARSNGARVVVIDPVRTITAESADWHIQPRPGTDVALMLAMMHVLVRDDLIDRDYVAAHAEGFDRLAEHVRGWSPERAAEATGVPAAEIEELTAAYGTTTPAFIRTLIGAEHAEHGAMFFRALGCLPVLTGAWRHRGGGLSRSVGVWSEPQADDSVFDVAGSARRANVNHLGRLLGEPGIEVLFVWNGNPLVSVPNAGEIRRGLERRDLFTVVSEQFITDTARYADVVFPATTQLEHLDVIPSWGHLYLGWNEPAIAAPGEAVPNTELWRRLAAAMGFDDPEFRLDDETLIRMALRNVDLDLLRAQGWVRLDLPDELLPYADGGFATPSGKALLWSDELAAAGHGGLPDHRPPAPAPGALVLLSPKNHTRFLNSSYSHMHGAMESTPVVEMADADAAARSIGEGDLVRVHNQRGSLTLPAAVSGRVAPGTVAIPWGWWGAEFNVNALTSDTLTDWGGGVAYHDTRVDVDAVAG
jgi:anaerobic selenocysteine-containing dehydrogenase